MAVEQSGTAAAVALVEITVAMAILAIATFVRIGLSILSSQTGQNYSCTNQRHKHCTVTARRKDWKSTSGSEDCDITTLNLGCSLPFSEGI